MGHHDKPKMAGTGARYFPALRHFCILEYSKVHDWFEYFPVAERFHSGDKTPGVFHAAGDYVAESFASQVADYRISAGNVRAGAGSG